MVSLLWIPVCLLALPYLFWIYYVFTNRVLNKIPGPQPLPFAGNALELGKTPEEFLKNILRLRAEYGDTFRVYVGPKIYVVTDNPDFMEQLLSSTVNITKGDAYRFLKPWLGEGLLISTGKKWKERRRIMTPAFHFKILETFVQKFNSVGDILVKKLLEQTGKPIDIYPCINLYSLDNICETSMGIEVEAQSNHNRDYVEAVRNQLDIFIRRTFSAWFQFDFLFKFSEFYDLYKYSLSKVHEFSLNVIRNRRSTWVDKAAQSENEYGTKEKVALLDILLQSESSMKLTDADIQEEIDTFIFEGHDTVTSGTSFALYCLSINPDVQKTLYEEITLVLGNSTDLTIQTIQEMKYLDMVVKEAQRLYPSVPMFQRTLEKDEDFGEYHLPKGTYVTLFIYSMHHDPEYFPDPEKFIPERFLPENQAKRHHFCYVPFSAGPRNCIGQRFAMLEMKSAIIKVLRAFELLPVENRTPALGIAAVLKSYNGIYVKLKPRN